MRFGRRAQSVRVRSLEITPMIDVVFLLIIFFMTTARFALETRADLDLPKEQGEQQEESEEAGIVINIDETGAIIVDRQTITLDGLERIVIAEVSRLRGRDPASLKLMIRADRNGDSARLNQVISRLQRAGVGAARLATEVPR
jgi:biopolymer transport protein ExbD